MKRSAKIYVAGHGGLLGKSILANLKSQGFKNIVVALKRELDLRNEKDVSMFFKKEKPEYVFLCAAKVGNMEDNINHPADFFYDNIRIQNNVIGCSQKHEVKRLIFYSANCAYPRNASNPIKENSLLTGPFEPTNELYAVAKIAGLSMCLSFNKQYGTKFITLVPASMYGTDDHFGDKYRSHIVPDIFEKIAYAIKNKIQNVKVSSHGGKIREFIHADDVACASIFMMNYDLSRLSGNLVFNVGTGISTSYQELGEKIKKITNFSGDILWTCSQPQGMPEKFLDSSKIQFLGWRPNIKLTQGLKKTWQSYKNKTPI